MVKSKEFTMAFKKLGREALVSISFDNYENKILQDTIFNEAWVENL